MMNKKNPIIIVAKYFTPDYPQIEFWKEVAKHGTATCPVELVSTKFNKEVLDDIAKTIGTDARVTIIAKSRPDSLKLNVEEIIGERISTINGRTDEGQIFSAKIITEPGHQTFIAIYLK